MTEIARVASTRTAALRPRGGPGPSAFFSLPGDEARTESVSAPIPLGGLLGLQEDPTRDETPARQQADNLLQELAALQRNLLGGGDPAPVLQRLDGMLATAPTTASPPLLAVLSAVRLRARVELARRQPTPFR